MIDALLAVLGITGGVSLAFVLAGLVSDGLLPWLDRAKGHDRNKR